MLEKIMKNDLLDVSENVSQNNSSTVKQKKASSVLNVFLPYLIFQLGLLVTSLLFGTRRKQPSIFIMGSNRKFNSFYS